MAATGVGDGYRKPGRQGFWGFLVRNRFWFYGAILLAIVVLRLGPNVRSYLEDAVQDEIPSSRLTLAGLDLAPVLIPRLADAYHRLYPDFDIRLQSGGTRQALEDLFNRKADVAFLSRPMTADEVAIVQSIGDTALSFPIALSAISVLVQRSVQLDSLPVADLREWISEGRTTGSGLRSDGRLHIYAPDPNLGLWTALLDQLELSEAVGDSVIWLASDHEVAAAVGRDPLGVGFASMLALPQDLGRLGARALRITGTLEQGAVRPESEEVATGTYPLFHYLYAACRPQGGAIASGFVSFLHSGRGQRLVAREGFLPARDVPREVQLTRKTLPRAS